ncbi:hypothetical protein J3L18_05470 [Mucilaginibacter gossypii]|uniref:hypothetical protein n=1 Tax=Mucilaginibacter gossypii TaxID=551996 RepID=UPI00101A0353|nr:MULTISPECIES: hypothetical protein [Mucilaginibacter]QTE38528.1 hypothetical protein J3L18_05470 [Mucilaginibacter gossypii]
MPKQVIKTGGRVSTKTSFMWVLGFGYKSYFINQWGNNVVKVSQTILPFCVIERVQLYQKQ